MEVLKALLWFVLILIPLTLAGVLVMGGGDGHWEESGLVRINRPKDVVYEWLITPNKRTEWVEGLVECRASDLIRLKEGTELREIFQDGAKRIERTIVLAELETDKLVVMRTSTATEDLEIRYQFEFSGKKNQTLIRVTCVGQFHDWTAKVLEPIFSWSTFAGVEGDVERLKEAVENPGRTLR